MSSVKPMFSTDTLIWCLFLDYTTCLFMEQCDHASAACNATPHTADLIAYETQFCSILQ